MRNTVSYGIVKASAMCSCCREPLRNKDAVIFRNEQSQGKKIFICDKCFNIMGKCKDNVHGGTL